MKKYKLGELGEIRMCKRILKEETNAVSGIPFFKIGTFGNVADVFITKKKFEEYKAKYSYPKKGDVLISAAGTIGRTVVYNGEDAYFQDSNIVWIENDESKVVNALLYYAYKNVKWKVSNGSTILRLYNDDLRRTEIFVPADISVQKKIASILSSLDKRIENLRAQNRVLEQTAKTIYDYTFLQCAGHKTTYNKTLNRNIPADWEVKKLGDCLASISTGLNPRQNFTLGNGSIKYITVKNLTLDGSIDYSGCDFIDESARAKVHKRSNIKVGDILFASISPLGRCHLIQEKPEDWDINESVFSLSPADLTARYYLYSFLRSQEFIAKAEQRATGSIFLGIRVDTLKKMEVLWPDSKTLGKFNTQIEPIFKKQLVNTKQIEALTTQRNTLLPLLMTGQIEV